MASVQVKPGGISLPDGSGGRGVDCVLYPERAPPFEAPAFCPGVYKVSESLAPAEVGQKHTWPSSSVLFCSFEKSTRSFRPMISYSFRLRTAEEAESAREYG